MLTRREWMQAAGGSLLAGAAGVRASAETSLVCLFSKHLPELNWSDLGRAVKDTGFDGVDLTVRTGGHVRPEQAPADLPRAIDDIRRHGVAVPMITTEITSAASPLARPLLTAAAKAGVRYFKTGYWRYSNAPDVQAQAAAAGAALVELAALARDCGIELGFHNHAGYIGGAIWEIAPAMDRTDARWAGYYFDPRHAVAEGGGGAWKAASHLVAPRLKMLAVKDCLWSKTAKGWQIDNCPLGDGIVDWSFVAGTLREARFSGPISLHLEYELPKGTQHTLKAADRDLAFLKRALG